MSVSKNYRDNLGRLKHEENGATAPDNFPPSQNYLKISYNPATVLKFVLLIIFCLVLLSTLGELYSHFGSDARFSRTVRLFFLDREKTIPAFYSSLALFFCGILLAVIAKGKYQKHDKYRRYWKFLSWIFVYLAIDENVGIHELTGAPVKNMLNISGFLSYAWVIPGIILFSLFVLVYLKFVLSLPAKIKVLFISAAAIFVTGALGIEMIGANLHVLKGTDNWAYVMVFTIEETLEMVGIAVFMYALLEYLKQYVEPLKIG